MNKTRQLPETPIGRAEENGRTPAAPDQSPASAQSPSPGSPLAVASSAGAWIEYVLVDDGAIIGRPEPIRAAIDFSQGGVILERELERAAAMAAAEYRRRAG